MTSYHVFLPQSPHHILGSEANTRPWMPGASDESFIKASVRMEPPPLLLRSQPLRALPNCFRMDDLSGGSRGNTNILIHHKEPPTHTRKHIHTRTHRDTHPMYSYSDMPADFLRHCRACLCIQWYYQQSLPLYSGILPTGPSSGRALHKSNPGLCAWALPLLKAHSRQ